MQEECRTRDNCNIYFLNLQPLDQTLSKSMGRRFKSPISNIIFICGCSLKQRLTSTCCSSELHRYWAVVLDRWLKVPNFHDIVNGSFNPFTPGTFGQNCFFFFLHFGGFEAGSWPTSLQSGGKRIGNTAASRSCH